MALWRPTPVANIQRPASDFTEQSALAGETWAQAIATAHMVLR
jgi:hypothetical protein